MRCNVRRGHFAMMDIAAALQARLQRHNYPDLRLQEAILEGEITIALTGSEIGQLNALTQIDLGDHRFWYTGASNRAYLCRRRWCAQYRPRSRYVRSDS